MTKSSSILFLFTLLTLTACQNDEEVDMHLSNEEAVEIVEESLKSETYGVSAQVEATTKSAEAEATALTPACGIQFDSTFSVANDPGAVRTYSYTVNYGYELACTGPIPNTFSVSLSTLGSYNTPRISSNDQSDLSATISNLLTGSEFLYDSNATRIGTQSFTVNNNTRAFSSRLNLTLINLSIDKTTYEIMGGTGTFDLTGSNTNGNAFSFTGDIVFIGNGAATLTINDVSYDIQI
ncbi:MAG: hypothetical protein AAF598_16175 [Bacteroidota bacterium]